MRTRCPQRARRWRSLLAAPSHALNLTDITTLYNPNCIQWAILGPCVCTLYTPCLLVTYWEPGWLVETVKQPGTTTLAPMQGLMTAAWGALGLPQLGGGGAGGTAGGSGRTNLHYNEAHVVPFPNPFGGPCSGCGGQVDLRLNYLSEIDPLWRTATGGGGLLEHLGIGPLGTWAPLYPRVGFGIHGHRHAGSVSFRRGPHYCWPLMPTWSIPRHSRRKTYGPTGMPPPQHVSFRLCIAARSCATRAQRNVAPYYSQTWNAAILRELSFLPDR